MPHLSEFDKSRVLALYQDGYAISAISRALGFSKSTVHLWVNRMLKEGHVTCRRRSGRPRITTEEQDNRIRRCVDDDPYRTEKEIKNMLHLHVSRHTIRRRLIEQGSTQMNETSQMENQTEMTDEVEPLSSVNTPESDVSSLWAPLTAGRDDSTSIIVRNGEDTVRCSEGSEDSYQTLHQRTIYNNNQSASQSLVQSGCDVNASSQPGPGGGMIEERQNQQGPLHNSCEWGLENVVQALTEHGTAINNKDINGKTPLHIAIEKQENGITSLLLCHPEIDLTVRDETGLTPFAAALSFHNFKAAQGILDRMPTAVEQYYDTGQNFLHMAIQERDEECVRFLLSNHVDVNARVQDTNHTPPLHLAAAVGSEMLVMSLIHAGARVDDCDAHQRTALHIAAGAGHADVVSALLQNGVDANASDSEQDSALHIACREGHLDCVRVLLAEQLDAEAINLKGRNPLHELARTSNNTAAEIAQLIIKCIPHYPLDKPDLDGNTALLLAYMKGNGNLCHTLVKSGANLGAMNKDGITVFDYHAATKQLLHSLLNNLSREPRRSEGDICLACGNKFGLTVHKYHCHHCGRILCNGCSNREIPILKFGLYKPVRVCNVCFIVLQGVN